MAAAQRMDMDGASMLRPPTSPQRKRIRFSIRRRHRFGRQGHRID